MIKRDYIMTMIEELGRAVAAILLKRKEQKQDEARQEVQKAFKELVGLNYTMLMVLSFKDQLKLLGIHDETALGKSAVAARLLEEEAELFIEQDDPGKALHNHMLSLCLYAQVFKFRIDQYIDDVPERIRSLISRLENDDLPDVVLRYTAEFLAADGQYGKAEDMLYRLLETDDPEAGDVARTFYTRLLEKDDRDLEAGNLPRNEVEEGLRELADRR